VEHTPVLLVEDELSDAQLLMRAFKKAGVVNPVQHVKSGEQALAYLTGAEPFVPRQQYPLPVLLLLDLKLPDLSGLAVLNIVRSRADLRQIPVVILTGDADPRTVRAAYDAGANSYLVKSADPEEIKRIVNLIRDYWLNLNQAAGLVLAADGRESGR
jgi:CheY-like chemotaxis protein